MLEPLEIAEAMGVDVTIHPFGLPDASRPCSTTDGYAEPLESRHGTKFHINANGATSPMRLRFTLMHELAHLWLEHPMADASVSTEVTEAEADFLASYLLAPDALVLVWVLGITIDGIADEFLVSREAASHIHRRVVRTLTRKAFGRPYDLRILAAASRRAAVAAPVPEQQLPGMP